MSNFIRPWDVNQEAAAEETKPKRGLFDNLGDAFSAISANFDDVRGSERLGDLRNELMNPELSDEEYNRKRGEYVQEYLNREDARRRYAEAHQNLVNDDSFLKNIDQMGGTLEGMAAQGIGTAVGAGVGFLTPVVGGTAMGAKIGNAAGAVAGAHLDARSVALQAEEDVINAGGTWEQAKQAYDETLKKAYITTIPETAADIVLGSRIGGAALNSGIARKIAGSTAGRVGASVLDPAAKIGTAVSRATRPIVGRGAGLLTDIGLQAGTEALQEVSQDYIADREVAKALGKQDNEYSLGGFKDYALSPQGLETLKTSAIMGGLFGGVGGALSSGQYLQRGSDTVMGNKGYHAANDAIQEGLLKLDDSGRLAAEKYIHQATGVSEAELATWSDADIISQYASSFAKRHNPNSTESMDASVTRGIAEAVRTTVDPKEIYGTREGDLTASQKIVLEKMGIDPDTTQEMFSSPAEKSVMEKAREEVSESQNEESKPAINAKMSAKLKEEIDANNGKTVQEVHQEEMAKNGNTNQQTTGNTDGVIGDIKYKNKVGNIEGEEWIRVPYTTSDGQELEGARYENKKTGKTATITQNNDGTFSVRDESNVSAHVFNTLEDAEKFLNEHRNDTRMFMKEGTDNTSEEIQDPNVVPEGGVNAETSGYTGVQINNISDLSSFMDKNQGLIDPEWFRQFIAITRSISPENWQIYLDTKNKGYVYENGRWGEVRGYADKDKSMGRAIVQLYAGADVGTVIHEIAHHGFWNLSERDRQIFTRYATKSMGKFVANLLDREYDNNFIAELRNIKEGDELYNKIISNACLGQVKYLLNTLNLQSLGITDISKVSPDQIELFREQQRQAVEERWAWEFSNWYVEGYVKGYTGNNIIQRILQRGCMSMEDSLTCIQKLWEHLHHRNSESETPIEDLYRSMNHPREQEQTQSTQEQTQSNPEQEQFTNEFYNPYEFEGNPDIEQPTQFMDSSEYMGDNTDTNNQEYVGNEEQNYNTQEQDFGNQEQSYDNTQGNYYYNPNDNSYNENEEEPQLNIKMTDETAEIFADEMLKRYGDNYEQMKSVWQNLYRNAKSRREQNWLVRMMRIAAKKYKEGQKANTKQTQQNTRQTPNNIGIEQRQVSVQSNQPVGVQERNQGYFNPNPLQLNQAQEQEKQQTRNTQQQEEQQKKPNVPQQEEVVDNNVEEEVEEKWTIRGTVGDTNERLGKIYKLGLEPREIDSIHLEINEVLDELEGESDKTVTKIRQSVTKRINAAKAALRGSKKSVDRGTDFYKLCSMSSLEETLNHYLDDNYYANGGVNQEKVNQVGNLIKRQLGEEMEEWAQPYSDETERAGRREKSEADRIEKERKQAEKEAKKKQQQQVESASQNLDILEQQIKNQQDEELTDEELEEKLENEVKKDNVVDKDKSKKTTSKKKTLTAAELADRKQRIRATAERLGMVVKKEDNKKNVQVNDVVDGWVEKLSKEEDYDEAMSKLQELLNTNEITEEEYNDISRRIEDYFEGEEENPSGKSYQKAGSTKAEQAQQILNKAFPNRRFQLTIASHASRVDFSANGGFDEFLLSHLGEGVGDQVHGYGLYVSIGHLTAKKYLNYFRSDQADRFSGMDSLRKVDIVNASELLQSGLDENCIENIFLTAESIPNFSIPKILSSVKEDMMWNIRNMRNLTSEQFRKEEYNLPPVKEIRKGIKETINSLRVLNKLIKDPQKIKIEILEEYNKETPTLYIVQIPDEKHCLEEGLPLNRQPKFVRDRLIKLLKSEIIDEYGQNISWAKDQLNGTEDGYYIGFSNIYEELRNVLNAFGVITGNRKQQKKQTSELLNMYGIKGMYYNGGRDGRCAVVFDDKAMDIVDKFQIYQDAWNNDESSKIKRVEIKKNPDKGDLKYYIGSTEIKQKDLSKLYDGSSNIGFNLQPDTTQDELVSFLNKVSKENEKRYKLISKDIDTLNSGKTVKDVDGSIYTEEDLDFFNENLNDVQNEINYTDKLLSLLNSGEKFTVEDTAQRKLKKHNKKNDNKNISNQNNNLQVIEDNNGNKRVIQKGAEIPEGYHAVKNNTRRFMNIGKGAKGSPITQDVLNKVEKEYNEKMQDKGVSVIQLLQMKYRNELSEKQGRENVSDIDDAIFSREYIQAHDEVNKEMFKKYKLFRGLDGEWRYRISDNTAKLTFEGIDMQEEARDNKLSGFSSNAFYKLGDLFKHNTLFKYYPELKDINVQFIYDEKSTKVGNYIDGENGSAGTLTINLGHGKFINKKTLNSQIVKTMLHELQHAIQDKEGFASGGVTDSNALYKKNAVGFIHRNKLNIINSFAKFLQGKGQTVYEMEMNGNKQEISDSMEKNVSGDFIPVVYIDKQRKSGIQGGVLFSLMMSMNDAYFENATLSQRDFDFVRDMLQSEKEIKYLDKLEQMFKDGKFNMGFSTQSFTKEQALNKAKQELSFLNDKKGIEKVISEYELGYGNNEAFETALDESGLEFDFYRSLYGEMEARDTAENYRNKNRNRFVPISEEGEYIKAKLGSGQVRINKRRYMAAQEKTATEKAQEQRDKRLEQQREAGITSDMYKDVYSVTFEKDATSNAENKRKMEYFDKRSKFWDKTEKNGRVIYTRKTPLDHHQKVIRYSGINDVEKTDKKKSKPEQWLEWAKDQLIKYAFNDMHFLAKAARKLGVYDSYVKLAVTKGYALKANTAMQRGIKYNGKYTRAFNDIIKEVGEEKQHDFVEYCIAKRILDIKELRPEIRQKMSPEEAQDIVNKVEKGADAKLFMKNQKDFVQYIHALLHVLVEGGVISEEEFQHHIKNDPNFVPLAKVMDDADFGFNCIQAARSIVNVKSPIKKIGTSMREVKNPFLEMQKRTAEYYAIASRNKAGQIFVNEIAGVLEKNAKGDTIAKGQGMIRKVKINEKDGKLITKPDQSQQIIYISNNGKQEFYQVSDPEIYRALRALDADQMGTLHKMLDPFLHAPSALIRETATMVPDFGVRNLVRDGGEAFMTSEHGFLPLIDQIWGMYQMANNTEWYQRFLEQQGEYGTYNREGANDNVARVEDTIDEKVNVLKNFNAIREAAFKKLTNKKNNKLTRAAALLQLMGSIPYAFIKSNKRINDYLEMGTRIGEFKNAKMGYDGTLDRLSKGGILDWGADINKAKQSDILAAGAAKEITLNFSQHGIIGKQLNRYIPFFNATLQGIYKMCNALELMATGTTLSGEKNSKLQHELLFKAALTTAMAIGIAAAGEGDDDYEEANQYEKENFWILPNGLRFPKDQVLGKLFGNVAEKSYAQWRKGKFEPSDILRSIKENFTPDRFMPATADIVLGGLFNYDSFYKSAIVPEYMQNKLGHLQKDLSTSNMASDVSNFLWKYTRTDVSAKRLDWAIQKNLTNCKKYVDAIYDLCKQTYDPKSFNEKMARGYDKNDSTGAFVGGLKDDVPKPLSLITGTFATNRTNYKSISDFYEKYNEYKTLATDEGSMSKEEKRTWKRYEQAYKKDKNYRKQLREIKQDSSLTGKEKREKADKIFKQQIKLAKWAEG